MSRAKTRVPSRERRKKFFNSDNQRILIPASLLTGALLALAAGLLSQGLWGIPPLPLNAVASLMGAPVVIWVLVR